MAREKKLVLTVENIRNINMENILQSVLRSENTTRSLLSGENNISLMTVKHVVDDLMAAGILVERESRNAGTGRKPKILEIAEEYGNILCVNLTSKDEISFLIYDIYERLLLSRSYEIRTEGKNYEEALREVLAWAKEELSSLSARTVAVAVCVPSAYDPEEDLMNYDLIPEFEKLHIRALFEKELGVENIQILHDVSAAAKSEYDSLNADTESQFYFYCGYGVGGFFINKGESVTGAENMAGEVGKMLISPEDDKILEDCVSVSAVKRQMKERGLSYKFPELLERYKEKDEEATEILEPVLKRISWVLYNLLWLYNPTRIVVDSSKSAYSELITEYFGRFMEKVKSNGILIRADVRPAKYDEYHTMRGCFHMALDSWIEKVVNSIE